MLSVPVPGGGSGKWYEKVPLANDFTGRVKAKSKKMSGRKKSDEEIRQDNRKRGCQNSETTKEF